MAAASTSGFGIAPLYPGASDFMPAQEDWALDPPMTRAGSPRHGRDLAGCARGYDLHEGTSRPIGAGFRVVIDAEVRAAPRA